MAYRPLSALVRALPGIALALWTAAAPTVWAVPPAQSSTPIQYGETVSSEITEGSACQVYTFDGAAGDPVTIDMRRTSGSLDGVLALYQGDGALSAVPLAENDDRPGGKLDPLITIRLPATDRYTISACRLQHPQMRVTTGTFALTLTGPDTATSGAVPTNAASLTEGMFESASATPTSTVAPLTSGLFDSTPAATPSPTSAAAALASGLGAAKPTPTPQVALTPTPGADSTESASYLAHPCESGEDAVSGITSSELLIDVFTASGDSYYAEQLTRTVTFRDDDDLNVVFRVQNTRQAITVAGIFCAPNGDYYDAGSSSYTSGGPYILGLDWEFSGEPWTSGAWFVEIYVDGAPDLTLGFTVK